MRGFLPALAAFALATTSALAQPYGIDTRTANASILINDLPLDAPGTMQLVRVFPQLDFDAPVLMGELPDGSGRMFVVERTGRVKLFPNVPDPSPAQVSTFLDLSGRIFLASEQGLLGLAFDPDYGANGNIYVNYSYYDGVSPSPGPTRVSRFTNDVPADNSIALATEDVIISIQQDFENHNGGMVDFGPDGYLYIGMGDGGSGDDPNNRGQDLTQLLGKMLRLDVTSPPTPPLNYAIPPDNPFAADPPLSTRRKEIYAWGMRNPWRWSFDKLTNLLYCADVGQNTWEEIDIIENGKNYGWRTMEGAHCNPAFYPLDDCDRTGLALPILEYGRSLGASITGGYVYFGAAVPSLYGAYIYADYVFQRIWALRFDGSIVTSNDTLVNGAGFNIAGFGQDASGEVYVLNFSSFGGIYVLRPASPPPTSDFPLRLSDDPDLLAAGLGQDQTAEGIIPYEPSAKLWSDGAEKERFIAIPGADQAGYQQYGGWDFPEKTILIKNFLLDLDESTTGTPPKRIETRLLYKKGGVWNGFSYEWNDAETDAQLLPLGKSRAFTIVDSGGTPFNYSWQYPSRQQCSACHTAAANNVLGLNTPQMNFDFAYPDSGVADNQLRTYDHINLFAAPLPDVPANLPKMPDPADLTASLEDRARAYLAANCAMCHQPGGTAPTSLDLRWQAPNAAMNAIGAAPINGNLGIPGAMVIRPGNPGQSVILLRMTRRGANQMPPLATSRIDDFGSQVIADWIGSLPPLNAAEEWALYD